MITYNHEEFLGKAIDSVFMQQTDFTVELVIGDDASPDGTRAMIEEYTKQYERRIKWLAPARNMGIMPNLMATMAACTGEFIAILEGDDYWTDPTKLQQQVDALRANPDCSLCFHDAETFNSNDNKVLWKFSERFSHILPKLGSAPQRFTQLDLGRFGWFIPSASIVFRASSLPLPLPDWFVGVFSGDYTMQLLATRNGPALYLTQLMSRYRIHEQGIMKVAAQSMYQIERRIHENRIYKKLLPREVHANANYLLSLFYLDLSGEYNKQGKILPRLYYYAKGLTVDMENFKRHFKRLMNRRKPPQE